MKWNRETVTVLKKKASRNFPDEKLPEKITELDEHLTNYDNILLNHQHKHEWSEVERLADEIDAVIAGS